MRMRVVMEHNRPTEGRGRQAPFLWIIAAAGENDDVAGVVERSVGWGIDRGGWRLVVTDGETRRSAGGRTEGVAYPATKHGTIILRLHTADGVGGGHGSRDINGVALPLIAK